MGLRKFALSATAVGATAMLALSGCTANGTPEGGSETANGGKDTLTLAMSGDILGWDPTKMIGADVNIWYEQAIYDRLFNCSATAELGPNVLEDWEINDDNTEFVFHIRPDQVFSDGTALDAEDVKASIDYISSTASGPSAFPGISTEIVDDLTVVVAFEEPNPTATTWWCASAGSIVPAEVLEAGDFASPVGSGPYTYDEAGSTPGSEYIFERNDENWNADAHPYKRLVVKVISDATATLNALKTGQVSGAMTLADSAAEAQASGLPQVPLLGSWAGLILGDRNGTVVPALADVDVRRAINMVFDQEAIAERLYRGEVDTTSQIFRPGSAAWIEDLGDPYPFDVEAAQELMADAGYADGFDIEIPLIEGFGWGPELPVAVEQLGLLNIRAEVVTLSGPNALTDLLSGRFPIIFWPLGNSGNSIFDINAAIAPDGIWNTQKATDPEVTRLVELIQNASAEEAPALQKELNEYIVDQAWFAPWVYPVRYFTYAEGALEVPEVTDMNGLAPNLRDLK